MRSLRELKRLVSRAEIHSRPQVNKTVLDDLLKELAAGRKDVLIPAGRHVWGGLVQNTLARVAAVAVMICIMALVVVSYTSRKPARQPAYIGTPSAADLLTVGRLNAACRRGGLPEIERQCEQAAQRLQTPPERVSMEQLIREMRGT